MNDLTDADIREALDLPSGIDPAAEPGAQGSIEWLMERVGHVTCSRFKDVLDFNKSGKESSKRAGYRREIVVERMTGRPIEHYLSTPMREGIEKEPFAKMAYEARTGAMLRSSGFRRHAPIKWVGGSPDALIGDDGGLECKCPLPTTHLDTLIDGMDEEHLPQIQGLMWIHDAAWWDFCSYCPVFEEPHRTYIQRITRDDEYIAWVEKNVRQFLAEVEAMLHLLGEA